jgi:mannose-6-phosphate isomerase-like protein (cupin superfamily)
MTEDLPRTIENPITGERVTFLATAEETNGEYVRFRYETPAGAPGVVMHYHLAYTEAFEVLEGRLDVCVGTKENHLALAEGESAFVPLNTAHRFWNSSTEPVVFEVEIRPACNFEKAIRAFFGLAADGKTNDKAVPKNIFELALIYELSESRIVGMPLFLQKAIFGALARIARWKGYDPEFSEYTKPDGFLERRRPPPSREAQLERGRNARLYGLLASGPSLSTLAALTAILALLFLLVRRRNHWSSRRRK